MKQHRMTVATYALVASISNKRGLVYWHIFKKSVNIDKFLIFLTGVREET
jgi:hypothetical protein